MLEREALHAFTTLIMDDKNSLTEEEREGLFQTLDRFCATASIAAMRRVFSAGDACSLSTEVSATYLARQFGRCNEHDTSE